ncbi:MAG: hypothetical protein II722_10690, partial [Ruminococcus sp.]|nr:hypothetical protein [Ruminococcus sp.]
VKRKSYCEKEKAGEHGACGMYGVWLGCGAAKGVFDEGSGIAASAESTAKASGDYEYQILEDGTAQITKYDGVGGEVTITSVMGMRRITSIGYFYDCRNLLHVYFGNNVQSIDSIAFAKCEHLKDSRLCLLKHLQR